MYNFRGIALEIAFSTLEQSVNESYLNAGECRQSPFFIGEPIVGAYSGRAGGGAEDADDTWPASHS